MDIIYKYTYKRYRCRKLQWAYECLNELKYYRKDIMSAKNIKFGLFSKTDCNDLKEEYTYLEDSMFEEYGSRDVVEQTEEVN